MNFYELSRLLPDIVSPLTLSLLLLVAGLLLKHAPRWRATCMALALSTLMVFSLPWIAIKLIASLEDRYPALQLSDIPEANVLILLGGGLNIPSGGLTRAELGPSGDRIVLAAELYRAGKAKQILISAGSSEHFPNVASEGEHTARLLEVMGVPRAQILIEDSSANTRENAVMSQALLARESLNTTRVLLVTSAFHMPRARALFCTAGLDTIGITANHWINPASTVQNGRWFFQATSLAGSSRVLREYLGIIVYGLSGRLDLSALRHDQACTSKPLRF